MPSENNKRIAKNTIFLYFRMLFSMGVSLYTSRVVLETLGVEDFGIYNVVGGIVVMFVFLNAGMVQASQRFLSFEIGCKNYTQLKDLFATILTIHFLLAIVFFLSAELFGLWFLNAKMNINASRMVAANWVFQWSILAFIVNIISVPYNATIIAHERMKMYAYVSIVEVSLKLLIVYLIRIISYDKLIIYAILQFLVAVIIRIVYGIYCRKKFTECQFRLLYNRDLFHKILSFATWSFVGNIGFTFRSQGVNVLINLFFGTAINAARGIAYQVSAQISGIVSNFQMAIIPQITKRYAAKEIDSMLDIVFKGSKYSFFLLYIIALPVIYKAPYILELWLGSVPAYTTEFLRLVLIVALIDSAAIPLGKAIDSTGKIKIFQISITFIMLADIPLSYILLKLDVKAYFVMYVAIFTSLTGLFVRLFLLKKNIPQVTIRKYLISVLLRCVIVLCVTFSITYSIHRLFADTFMGIISFTVVSVLLNLVVFFIVGMQSNERSFVVNKLKAKKCNLI
jgi:O-antigen/teichoic acid export membrane protein